MTPQTEEVKVNIEQVMQAASSLDMTGDSADVNGDGDHNTLSRRTNNLWADDEDWLPLARTLFIF